MTTPRLASRVCNGLETFIAAALRLLRWRFVAVAAALRLLRWRLIAVAARHQFKTEQSAI